MKRARLVVELLLSLLLMWVVFPLLVYVAYITAGLNVAWAASVVALPVALGVGALLLFRRAGYIAVLAAAAVAAVIATALIAGY
jgi:uncharacterized membrane protein (DUF485 family)